MPKEKLMGPANIPAEGHINLAMLPPFMVWLSVIVLLVGFAWYLERQRNDDD